MRKSKKLISLLMKYTKQQAQMLKDKGMNGFSKHNRKPLENVTTKELGIEPTNRRFYDDYQIELINDFVRSGRNKYIIVESKINKL